MKKVSKLLLSLLLVLTLAIAFASCNDVVTDNQDPPTNDQTQGGETPDEDPTEKPNETPDENPEETPEDKPEEKPEEKPEDKPEEPTDEPTGLESITLDVTELSLYVNGTYTISVTFNPENAENKELVWESSDDSVVLVSDGVVCAVSVGSATVTAKADNGVSASCVITVEEAPVAHECIPASPVVENRVEATCTDDGSYELAVYCSICSDELSRETKTIYR